MMLARLSTLSLLSLALLMPYAQAQKVTRKGPNQRVEPPKIDKELERKATTLLDEVADEAQGLKLPENRVRVQLFLADLLWPRDETRARAVIRAATTNLAAVVGSIQSDDPQYYNLINTPMQLRQQMLQLLVQRDPKLALEALRATRLAPPPQQPGANYVQPDQELVIELSVAEQIAAADPQQALQLAEESLSKGVSYNLSSVIERLRQKDAKLADQLAGEVIQQLHAADFMRDSGATNVAAYLLQATQPAASGGNSQQMITELPNPRQLHVSEQARRELLNTMVRAALNPAAQRQSGNMYGLVSALQQALPEVEHYAPAQVPALRRQLSAFEQTMNPQAALWRRYQPLMNEGSLDALLEAAASAPPEIRNQLYQAAVNRAYGEGGLERARDIINAHIENQQQRTQMLRDLDQRTLWEAAQRGDVEQATRLLERIPAVNERVNAMLNLARVVVSKGQTQTAQRLVDEAAALVSGRAQNMEQFAAQLQVAQAYTWVAPARAFEIVEARIEQLNELISAAAVVDGFGQQQFEQDELRLQGGYMWNALIDQCSNTLAELARVDFERARAAADKFQHLEARLPARLAIARAVLMPQSPPGAEGLYVREGGH
ncbi:MAG: hypothetical protein ACJ74W_24665 [Pyrinomonadaceae bacterium]